MKQFFSSAGVWRNEGLAVVRIFTGFFMAYHGWEVFDNEKMNTYFEWDQFKTPYSVSLVYAEKKASHALNII